MSVEPTKVSEHLKDLYTERSDSEWKTVSNCIDELIRGDIVPPYALPCVAFSLLDDSSQHIYDITRRAQKLNNRVGQAGRREAHRLAKTAVRLSVDEDIDTQLYSHIARVGFQKKLDADDSLIVSQCKNKVLMSVEVNKPCPLRFEAIPDQFTWDHINKALTDRDQYFSEELFRRDLEAALMLGFLLGDYDFWDLLDRVFEKNEKRFIPYQRELMIGKACCYKYFSDKSNVMDFSKLPPLKQSFMTLDDVNFPLLALINEIQKKQNKFDIVLSVDDFVLQIVIEILFLRSGEKL